MPILLRLFSLPATTLVVIISLIIQPVLAQQQMSGMVGNHLQGSALIDVKSDPMTESKQVPECMQHGSHSHHASQASLTSSCTTASHASGMSQQADVSCCSAMDMPDSCCNITHCQSHPYITASLPAISHAQTSHAPIIRTFSSPIKHTDNLFRPPIA
ncbi:hypothetical protein [Photobacterium swingsii]|uniref:CopL family metal-binding regulatory protein n=1 Tax=Photobacterium swingsii TaxID=680026 RepID=A0A0J8XXC0_9GAMM|nr:hypothetical protein [Photobacterium swingsii]KMV30034.1 hypothetical protein AB733_13985 [Photobacterium swingsii]PSW22956.1 hypothetical protein C9I94_17385 [Photobacterium swingsii]